MYRQEKQGSGIFIKILSAAGGIIAGFLVCRLFFMPFRVTDSSMEPNLKPGDTAIILKHGAPKRGDIVLIESPVEPGRMLAGRVAAMEGDTVEIRDKVILVNNIRLRFPWKTKSSDRRVFPMNFSFRDNMPAVKLTRNHYFILGDNMDGGYDSRTLGAIPGDCVIGRVIYRY
ncbi:MAG: signal peptidase I [Spirochaetes bacterium]|nr:signal peptidase I [Spirochaetota bacterium]